MTTPTATGPTWDDLAAAFRRAHRAHLAYDHAEFERAVAEFLELSKAYDYRHDSREVTP